MFKKLSITILLISLLTAAVPAQTNATESADDKAKATKKAAIEFLRETATDVERLRSMENRISFSSELASLMWFHDEKEAKGMYGQVVSDFKQLMMQFDGEMNTAVVADDDDSTGGGGFLFGGRGQSKVQRKLRIALAVRQQIALSLAEHAPDLALNFFYDSVAQLSNPEFRKQAETMDKYFESRLLIQIAESDANKGVEYGRESIKRQINSMHIELLKKIYAKDASKGVDFGQALLSAAKSDPKRVEGLGFYQSLIVFAETNIEAAKKTSGKGPVYTIADIREMAEMLYQGMMADSKEMEQWQRRQYIPIVEKHLPGRGAQLRSKFKDPSSNSAPSPPMAMASNRVMAPANGATTTGIGTGRGTGVGSGAMDPYEREMKEREEKAKAEAKMLEDFKKLGQSDLPKEERDKVIAQARKIIAETKGKDKKITALSILAASVSKLGDKDLANEIMLDAERLVSANPKNYQDFMLSWILAGGYAEANPDKAFPLLEGTILKANVTLDAFVRVAEFVDVQEELVSDGEVQVGMFGGEMIRGLTRELGAANSIIRTLADADFNRTKGLANTFDRTEIRVLAKMLVLRAMLDKKSAKPGDLDIDEDVKAVLSDGR